MPVVVAGTVVVPVDPTAPPRPLPSADNPVVEVYGQLTDPAGSPAVRGKVVVTAIPPVGASGVVSYPAGQQEFAIPLEITIDGNEGNYSMRLPAAAELRPPGSRYRVDRQPEGGSVLTDVIYVPGTAAREWLPNLIVA